MDEDFSLLSDDIIEVEENKRATCEKCRRPKRVCWCSFLPENPLEIRGKVIILQHPDEEKRNLKTGPMLFNGLAPGKCLIYYGKKFPVASKHQGLTEVLSEPGTYVLYPGVNSKNVKEVIENHHPDEMPYNLVLIDGTWSQAKSMYYHSPFLHSLPQVSLPEEVGPSLYVVRTQPAEGCLSTVESAAHVISIMEKDNSILDKLVNPLRALCTFQLQYGAVEHQDKVTLMELGQYRKPVGKRTIKFLKQTCSKSSPIVESLSKANNK